MAEVSPWLSENLQYIPAGSDVLDIACGKGRHILPLLDKNCRVWAVDRDAEALMGIDSDRRVLRWAWDLEADGLPGMLNVDVTLVFNYLYRPLFANLSQHIRQGGLILHETFHIRHQALYGRPRRKQFCWQDGEAASFFSEHGFQVTACEDGVESNGRWVTRIAAVKM